MSEFDKSLESKDRTDEVWLDEDTVTAQLGDTAYLRLNFLAISLYGDDAELNFRVASSLNTRGEAELLGMNMPRFGMRVYLNRDRTAFINARRLQTVQNQFRKRLESDRKLDWGSQTDAGFEKEIEMLLEKNPAADSLLTRPKWLESYHLLETDLGKYYDEPQISMGMPYMSHVQLFAGGMCAQAVAYQATAIQHRYANGVYGQAEITILSAAPESEWIDLGGMTTGRLKKYFNHKQVGLSALPQGPFGSLGNSRENDFLGAIESYVLSNQPVILPVDFGEIISGKHDFGIKIDEEEGNVNQGPLPHAIIVVGCGMKDGQRSFVFNDPTTLPFLTASEHSLAELSLAHEENREYELMPVAPAPVKLPLLGLSSENNEFGLYGIIETIQFRKDFPHGHGVGRADGDQFRLINLAEPADQLKWRSVGESPAEADLDSMLRNLKMELPNQWYWIQLRRLGEELVSVLWDATQDPFDPHEVHENLTSNLGDYLSAVAKIRSDGTVQLTYISKNCGATTAAGPVSDVPTVPKELPRGDLRASLLTSYSSHGCDVCLQHWRNEKIGCEAYLWMQPEVDRLRDMLNLADVNDAVDIFTRASEDEGLVKYLSEHLLDSQNSAAQEVGVIGLASFIPEIVSKPHGVDGAKGQSALRGIAKLAIHMNENGGQVRNIEVVAGSMVRRTYTGYPLPVGGRSSDLYLSRLRQKPETLGRLVSNLRDGLSRDGLSGKMKESGITIGFELEPGPLFVLRDKKALLDLTQRLSRDNRLRGIVGLNLDIPHWRIAGGDHLISWLLSEEGRVVRRRIVHAHISGHHPKAHFGDLPLDALPDQQESIKAWLDFVAAVAGEGRHVKSEPAFSGFVSHEYEAAGNIDRVWHGADVLHHTLRPIQSRT